jgi:hypothetical protein
MFTKMSIVSVMAMVLLLFAGQQAKALDEVEVIDYTWYEDDYSSGTSGRIDVLDNASEGVTNIWDSASNFIIDLLGGSTDDFESVPRAESGPPQGSSTNAPRLDVQYQYEYVTQPGVGYPKWIMVPIE